AGKRPRLDAAQLLALAEEEVAGGHVVVDCALAPRVFDLEAGKRVQRRKHAPLLVRLRDPRPLAEALHLLLRLSQRVGGPLEPRLELLALLARSGGPELHHPAHAGIGERLSDSLRSLRVLIFGRDAHDPGAP